MVAESTWTKLTLFYKAHTPLSLVLELAFYFSLYSEKEKILYLRAKGPVLSQPCFIIGVLTLFFPWIISVQSLS